MRCLNQHYLLHSIGIAFVSYAALPEAGYVCVCYIIIFIGQVVSHVLADVEATASADGRP